MFSKLVNSLKFTKKEIFTMLLSFLFVLIIFPFFDYYIVLYKYSKHKDKVQNITGKKVIVFYDDFHGKHGELVYEAFTKHFNKSLDDYTVVKLSTKEIEAEELKLLIKNLLSKNKKVYFTSSVSPTHGVNMYLRYSAYKEFLQNDNIVITQAMGNNADSIDSLSLITDNAKEIDTEIYKLLNTKKDEIKKLSSIKEIKELISKYGIYGISWSKIRTNVFGDNKDDLRNLISSTIEPIILKYKLQEHRTGINNMYFYILSDFSFSLFMAEQNTNVIFVGSSTQLNGADEGEYFLDLRIKGLLNYNVRETALLYDSNDSIIGTSFSAPIRLAKIMNNEGNITN